MSMRTCTHLRIFFSYLLFRTTFSEFASRHGKDPRFKAIDKMKDREAMFTEFMAAFRKKEKEDSKNKGEKVNITPDLKRRLALGLNV